MLRYLTQLKLPAVLRSRRYSLQNNPGLPEVKTLSNRLSLVPKLPATRRGPQRDHHLDSCTSFSATFQLEDFKIGQGLFTGLLGQGGAGGRGSWPLNAECRAFHPCLPSSEGWPALCRWRGSWGEGDIATADNYARPFPRVFFNCRSSCPNATCRVEWR